MPEFRKDSLLGKWVILSEARGKRPSDFREERPSSSQAKAGPCAFCKGREHETGVELFALREGSQTGAPDWRVRVVKNIYPAVSMESSNSSDERGVADDQKEGPFKGCCLPGTGSHEVVIETPLHGLKFTLLSLRNVEEILLCFKERMSRLRDDGRFKYVQVFKNRGKAAGASMDHSHSQILALPIIPHHVDLEINNTSSYLLQEGTCIFCDIVKHEIADGSRLIESSTEYAVLAAYAPKYPYEIWIVPQSHSSNFENINDLQLQSLAKVLLKTTRRLERLFNDVPFNYMVHTYPFQDCCDVPLYHWTIRVIPHLMTLGGFELGSGCHIIPVFPEKAASQLRELEVE